MNLYFSYQIDTKTKLDTIKALGFDEFFTGIYDQKETMTWLEQIQYAQKIGLNCTMIHCSYYEPKLNSFWLPGQSGDEVMNDYIDQINQCGRYTKNFVVHLNGSYESVVSAIGIERLKKILSVCEKYNLNLCVENVFSSEEIPYIFEHIQHPLLKICYDCGHRNYLTPQFNICEKFGQYVAVLHLHENNGKDDEHKKLTVGSPFFNHFRDELQFVNQHVVMSYELKNVKDNWQEYLKSALDSLQKLSEKIK